MKQSPPSKGDWMRHDKEFWARHVQDWGRSGLTQRAYCRRHRLTKGTLGYWVSTLKRMGANESALVEVGRTETREARARSAIELVVEGRYLLRLWPGMEPAHMKDVLAVLERSL